MKRFVKSSQTTSKFSTNYPKKPVLYCRKMWIWKEIALKKNAHFTRMLGEIWKKGLEIHKQTTSKKKLVKSWRFANSPVLCCMLLPACLPKLPTRLESTFYNKTQAWPTLCLTTTYIGSFQCTLCTLLQDKFKGSVKSYSCLEIIMSKIFLVKKLLTYLIKPCTKSAIIKCSKKCLKLDYFVLSIWSKEEKKLIIVF